MYERKIRKQNPCDSRRGKDYRMRNQIMMSSCRDHPCQGEESYTVSIAGSIGHGTVTKYSGSQIELHRLSVDKDASSVLTDTASLIDSRPISIQFGFDVKVADLGEAYSQYVLVISASDGARVLLAPPSVPSALEQGAHTPEDKDVFKGVHSDISADVVDANPTLAVLDVELDRLENPNKIGYYFSVDGSYYYFDREYISELDNRIRAYTDTNCEVYLRFSFGGYAPYVEFIPKLYAYSAYLASRYNGGDNGDFLGIIVGEVADRFSAKSDSDIDSYVKLYSAYLHTVSEATRAVKPLAKIFIPISDTFGTTVDAPDFYAGEQFLVSVCGIFDKLYKSRADISVMLCGDHTPFHVSAAREVTHSGRYVTERIGDFEALLSYIKAENPSFSGYYAYFWTPEENLSGSALSAAYTYNYLQLLFGSSAESFIVSPGDPDKLYDLRHVIKNVDTSKFFDASYPSLDIIGASSWSELIPGFDQSKIEKFRLSERSPIELSSVNVKGSYDIWRFAELNTIGAWYSFNGCNSISINVSSDYGRSLVAKIKPYSEMQGQYSGVMYSYDAPKDVSFADYMTYTLGISCESGATEVFEVKLVIGSESERIESSQIIKAGAMTDITVDIRDLDQVSYLLVNVKPVSNQEVPYNLYLNKITERSTRYTDERLVELEEAQNDGDIDIGDLFSDAPITGTAVASLCAVLAFIVIGFTVIFKKIDKRNKKSEE